MFLNLQNLDNLGLTNSSMFNSGYNYDNMSMNGSLFGFGFGNGCSYFADENGGIDFEKVGIWEGATTFLNTFLGSLQPEISSLMDKISVKIDAKQNANAFKRELNSADGNVFNRLTNNKYEELFQTDGKLKDDAKVDEPTLRKAFAKYRKAEPDERAVIAKQIVELWKNAPDDIKTPQYKTLYNHIAKQ